MAEREYIQNGQVQSVNDDPLAPGRPRSQQPWWHSDHHRPINDGYGNPTDGIGSPASGYGPGGVDNPAYSGGGVVSADNKGPKAKRDATVDHNTNMIGTRPQAPQTTPSPQADPSPQASFQPPAGAAAPPSPPSQPQTRTPGITDEVTRILMQRLNDLRNPGDVQNDPIYQQAVRVNQLQLLRSAERQRKALAERAAASGTRSTGGFNVGVRGIEEATGAQGAQFASNLAVSRLQQREAQLNEAIRLARAVGQDDIANQLEVQRLALQGELGRGDIALRTQLGMGQLGLGYDQLGFNYADLMARENRNAVIAGLGG